MKIKMCCLHIQFIITDSRQLPVDSIAWLSLTCTRYAKTKNHHHGSQRLVVNETPTEEGRANGCILADAGL